MLLIRTRQLKGGYREAFFNVKVPHPETGKPISVVERILGGGPYPELEILIRLRIRFPNQQIRLKQVS